MKPQVFVLGAPRSGTTLLYHMLLSSGQFANYMSETHVFNLVGPRFGGLAREANRQKLLDVWLRSFQFKRSGLDPARFAATIMKDCRSEGDFLGSSWNRSANSRLLTAGRNAPRSICSTSSPSSRRCRMPKSFTSFEMAGTWRCRRFGKAGSGPSPGTGASTVGVWFVLGMDCAQGPGRRPENSSGLHGGPFRGTGSKSQGSASWNLGLHRPIPRLRRNAAKRRWDAEESEHFVFRGFREEGI